MLNKVLGRNKVLEMVALFRARNGREWAALRTTFFSMLNKVVSLLAVIFYVRWTLPYLGAERFGVWMTMTSIITFLSIFSDLGLSVSMVNHVAAANANGDQAKLSRTTSSAFFFLLVMAALLGLLYYFSNAYILHSVTNGLDQQEVITEVRQSLTILVILFLASLPFIIVDKTLEGLQLAYISSIWIAVGNIFSLVAVFIIAQQQLGLVWLITGTVGVQSAARIFCFIFQFNGRLKSSRPAPRMVNPAVTQSLLRSGLILFLLNLFNVLAFHIDNIIITRQMGAAHVAQFAVMQKLVTVSLFFWFYTISLWPAFAEAHTRQDKKWIRKTVGFILKLNISLGLLMGLVIVLFSGRIIELWSANTIPPPSFEMALGFAVFIVLNGAISSISMIFNSGLLVRRYVLSFSLAAIVTFILKYYLVAQVGLDYFMFLPVLPFLLIYLIPCYLKYREYVRE